MVLNFRDELLQERRQADLTNNSPVELNLSPEERSAARRARKKAKSILKKKISQECASKFPNIVGKARVERWQAASVLEHWRDLPEAVAARETTTSNEWRRKVGAPLRGRNEGGGVPLELQRELDVLIMEMTAGASDVSERKEVVTAEQVLMTIHGLVDDWNSNVTNMAASVKAANEALLQDLNAGKLQVQAVIKAWMPVPTKLSKPSSRWARWFLKEWGWTLIRYAKLASLGPQ